MPSNVNITASLTVSPLPDSGTWFANAAAWTAYWNTQSFSASIPVATSNSYGVVLAAATSVYNDPGTNPSTIYTIAYDPLGNGVLQNAYVPSDKSFEEVKAQLTALNRAFINLKAALISAGLISA